MLLMGQHIHEISNVKQREDALKKCLEVYYLLDSYRHPRHPHSNLRQLHSLKDSVKPTELSSSKELTDFVTANKVTFDQWHTAGKNNLQQLMAFLEKSNTENISEKQMKEFVGHYNKAIVDNYSPT